MVRGIFLCMALVALSLAAMPLLQIAGGITNEKAALEAEFAALEPAQIDPAAGPSPEELNDIATAAGAEAEVSIEDQPDLNAAFSNTPHEGL